MGYRFFGGFGDIVRSVAPNPRIDADRMAHRTTHQLIDGDAIALAFDIPQGLVDAGNGTHCQGAAPIEATAVEHLPDVFDIVGVTANQIFTQFIDGGGSSGSPSFDNRFTPAANPLVG